MKELYGSLPGRIEAIIQDMWSHTKYWQGTVTSWNKYYEINFHYRHFSVLKRSVLIGLCKVAEDFCMFIFVGGIASSLIIENPNEKYND